MASVRSPPGATIADLGCSTGFLLEDLHAAHPDAALIGVDMIAAGLRKAHGAVPEARLLQADVCELPLEDQSVDAVVSANLLEHVRDDGRALREIARVLKPGRAGRAGGPRRPARRSTTTIAFSATSAATLAASWPTSAEPPVWQPREDRHLGSFLYPAFWLVKQRNRRRYDDLRGDALEARVTQDIARTHELASGRAHLAAGGSAGGRRRAAPVRDPFVRRGLAGAVMRDGQRDHPRIS